MYLAPTSNVTNLVIGEKQFSESSAAVVQWGLPTDLAGNLASELKYFVTYCIINMDRTCKNTTVTTETKIEITGLMKDHLYQFAVHVLNKYDVEGMISEEIYRTKLAGTNIFNQIHFLTICSNKHPTRN